MRTKITPFRFSAEFIDTLQSLRSKIGAASMADVIRFAVTRLAEDHPNGKKTGKKVSKRP